LEHGVKEHEYNWKNEGGFEGHGSQNEVKTRQRNTAEDNLVQMTNKITQTLRTKRASLSITGTKGCTTTMTQVDEEYITGVMSVQGVGVEV